ncbi:AAA family ATPase [Desulfitibacter alkalitolerans]|uniref:AAA family ATPase n=1 Tax=Desulfitibacter alkalitolerans TaxID=264641 RepID=UPI000489D027|nr:SMC family ATPase [Desulfitibacter alkalitolerans]
MKPIKLKLQGLHSYQNLQEVDFKKLCERGTFGIFGPTGSGKSTVLDAITLALFGKVERAPRNTQGILNHNSNKIYVSFTFELNSGNSSKRYTVERQFKKAGENTVQSGSCRLIEEDKLGQKVLADKTRDVDQGVIEILGLTADDFTRAVVLPQGKFAEFLSLQGRDRRMMLQRLFNLEAYGDKLQEKVKKRIEAAASALDGIEREKQGLGDASETALEKAKLALAKAEELESMSKNGLEKAQKNHDESREIWQKQIELNGIIKDKELLLEQENEMTESEKELTRAERAEAIRHLLEEQEHLDKLKSTQAGELAAAQENFDRTEGQVKSLQEAFLNTQGEWEEKQPLLIEKKAKLEEAKALERDIEALAAEGREINKSKAACTAGITELEKRSQELRSNREAKTSEQNKIKNLIKENTIAPEKRQQINISYNVYTQYQDILVLIKEGEKELNLKNNQYEKAQKELQQAEELLTGAVLEEKSVLEGLEEEKKRSPGDEKELQDKKKSLGMSFHHVNEVMRLEKEIEGIKEKIKALTVDLSAVEENLKLMDANHSELKTDLKALRELKADLEKQLKDKERGSLAALLVESLTVGMPCPVCGSREHPAPAQTDESMEEINILREKLAGCSQSLDKASEELTVSEKSIYQLQLSRDSLQERLKQEELLLEEKKAHVLEERSKLPAKWQGLDPHELKVTYDRETLELENQEKEIALWVKRKEVLEQLAAETKEKVNGVRSKKEILLSRTQGLHDNMKEAEGKLAVLRQRLAEKGVELDKARGSMEVSDIINQWIKLDQVDKKAAQLKIHLEKIEQELENTIGFLEKTENELKVKQLQEAELNTSLSQLKTIYEQKKALLYTITAGDTAEKLLTQTNIELDALKDKREKTRLNLDMAVEKKAQAEKSLTTLKADFASTQYRLDAVIQKLLSSLQNQDFANELDARNSLRPVDVRDELRDKLQRYNKKLEALLERERDLQKLLEQKTLSEHEWHAVQDQLKASLENYQKCLEEKGAAARVLQDIKDKHIRWRQLEEESSKLQRYENLLKDLKRVLTGNALVEFMAEEHLLNVARIASIRLGDLTNNRYTLEVDGDGGFIIRDDANGGFKRPVTSLSGGETFLVSFSLALALSSQIQLRGTYPLEFFFLDEGFGSLDQDLLEVVISALERLQMEKLSIGVISHVQEMRNQMTRKLIVTPAQLGGEGSKLSLEIG